MRWNEIDQQVCSVARTLAVVGDRWSLLIIRDLFLGTRRFEDFRRQLDISRPALTERLRKLGDMGVVEKRQYQDKPLRFEYHLTEKGLELYPIIVTMARWGDRWQGDGNGAPIEYEHKGCGHTMHAQLSCSECGEQLEPRDVRPRIGPGLEAALSKASAGELANRLPPTLRHQMMGE